MATLKNIRVMGENYSHALDYPDYVNARSLAANTAEVIAVPANASIVYFSAQADIYVRYGATTAAVPGDVTDGSACELNPTARIVNGLTQISVISTAACKVTASFFRQ